MTASWGKEYDPNSVADKLEAARLAKPGGHISVAVGEGVSFKGLEYHDYLVFLCSIVEFRGEIAALQKNRIVGQAVIRAAKRGKITAGSLLCAINELEQEYRKNPPQKLKMVTSISAAQKLSLRRATINGCSIVFGPKLPTRFSRLRKKMLDGVRDRFAGELPTDYMDVAVSVSARSDADAADKALDAIDLLRGIWNLYFNRGRKILLSTKQLRPFNQFVLGPAHTLHVPSGKLATTLYWYQPEFQGPIRPFNPGESKASMMHRFTQRTRKRLATCKYGEELARAIRRYTRALDLADWESVFLRLWSILEQLTSTGEGGYKVTIRRVSFLFEDRAYHRQILSY